MHYFRNILAMLSSAVLAAGLVLLLRPLESKPRPDNAHELAVLKAEVAELTSRLEIDRRKSEARNQSHRIEALNGSGDSVGTAPDDNTLEPDAVRPLQPEVTPEEIQAHVDSSFEVERIDPDWSRKAVGALQAHVQTVLPQNAAIMESECRRSMCRMRLSLPDPAAYRQFVEAAFHDATHPVPESGSSMYVVEETQGDGLVLAVYTAREGSNFPFPDAPTEAIEPRLEP